MGPKRYNFRLESNIYKKYCDAYQQTYQQGGFGWGLMGHAALLGSQGRKVDQEATDFVMGFVDAMEPRDAAEALLLAQMAATHQASMMLARHLNHVDTIPQSDCAERALNKTARTFATQMDTLKRYRSKGKQTVRVERVTVQDGGQAIVGNVGPGGRVREEM